MGQRLGLAAALLASVIWRRQPSDTAQMTDEERQRAQAKANAEWLAHWRVENGELLFDGKGVNRTHLYRLRTLAGLENRVRNSFIRPL